MRAAWSRPKNSQPLSPRLVSGCALTSGWRRPSGMQAGWRTTPVVGLGAIMMSACPMLGLGACGSARSSSAWVDWRFDARVSWAWAVARTRSLPSVSAARTSSSSAPRSSRGDAKAARAPSRPTSLLGRGGGIGGRQLACLRAAERPDPALDVGQAAGAVATELARAYRPALVF